MTLNNKKQNGLEQNGFCESGLDYENEPGFVLHNQSHKINAEFERT